jgi:hypothetical protein
MSFAKSQNGSYSTEISAYERENDNNRVKTLYYKITGIVSTSVTKNPAIAWYDLHNSSTVRRSYFDSKVTFDTGKKTITFTNTWWDTITGYPVVNDVQLSSSRINVVTGSNLWYIPDYGNVEYYIPMGVSQDNKKELGDYGISYTESYTKTYDNWNLYIYYNDKQYNYYRAYDSNGNAYWRAWYT